jgi:hypothetical protein
MQQKKTFLLSLSVVIFFSLQILPVAYGAGFRLEGSNGIVLSGPDYELIRGIYDVCQETERWEKLTNPNFPLNLIEWQLVINPGSSDKYIDKRIIGTVKNNSEKKFSEVKIEFTIYDEDGGQIAIVFTNVYDFKPGSIWKFEIPVTSDVGKVEFNGFYVPLKEIKTRGVTRSETRKFPLSLPHLSHLWERKDA